MEKKYVEIDGKKYQADEKGDVIKGTDGNPVPFVETPPAPPAPTDDLAKLAETNPAVAKLLQERNDAAKALADKLAADEEAARKDSEKKGEWEKLAKDEEQRRKNAETLANERADMLGKYKGTTKLVLDALLAQIPEDKRGLIPTDFHDRQKLEYVIANAKYFGVSVTNAVPPVPPGEKPPQAGDLASLKAKFNELVVKKDKSPQEQAELDKVAKQLKAEMAKAQK